MRGIQWVLEDELSGKRAPGAAPNTLPVAAFHRTQRNAALGLTPWTPTFHPVGSKCSALYEGQRHRSVVY